MENPTISSSVSISNMNDSINLSDILRVIGMQEVAKNVFTYPKKKKK